MGSISGLELRHGFFGMEVAPAVAFGVVGAGLQKVLGWVSGGGFWVFCALLPTLLNLVVGSGLPVVGFFFSWCVCVCVFFCVCVCVCVCACVCACWLWDCSFLHPSLLLLERGPHLASRSRGWKQSRYRGCKEVFELWELRSCWELGSSLGARDLRVAWVEGPGVWGPLTSVLSNTSSSLRSR